MDLGNLLGFLWAANRRDEDWQAATDELAAARQPVTAESHMLPLYDLALGQLWFVRADATRDSDDQGAAIEQLEVARRGVRPGAGVHLTASTLLGTLRLRVTNRTGDPVALEAAIEDLAMVVPAERARAWEKARSTELLAQALWTRYKRARDREDLNMAIGLALTALREPAEEVDNAADLHALLGSLYGEAYEETADPQHLDAAIEEYEQRLTMPFGTAEIQSTVHDNAGNAYGRRYDHAHATTDLDRAIEESTAAVTLAPADSDKRGRMWCNLAFSLLERGLNTHEREPLDASVQAARDGLDDGFDAPDVRPRLSRQLAHTLLARHALFGTPPETEAVFDEATVLLEEALRGLLSDNAALPVRQRLTSRSIAARVQSMLIGLHLSRSRTASKGSARAAADRHLDLAFATGEAAKAPLLTHEVLRRELTPPAELDEGTVMWESQMLGEAAGLDLRELLDETDDMGLVMRRMDRRQLVHAQLERSWDELSQNDSEAVRRYVRLRRNDVAGLGQALRTRPGGCDLVSLLVPMYIDDTGHEDVRMCFLLLRDGAEHPEVLCEIDEKSVAQALACMSAWAEEETSQSPQTLAAIDPLVKALAAPARGTSSCVAISPTTDTFGLPWQMLFSEAGWRTALDQPLPVLIVPSQALMLASLEGNSYAWTEDVYALDRLGIDDPDDFAQHVRISRPDSLRPATGAAVLGNPTGDLPSAVDEAREIAELLCVEPLLGANATREAVLSAIEGAAVVHVAAHAAVDAERPLRSKIALADSDLPASALLGSRGAAHLVVLSACHSGYGESLGGGELAGLSTALLRAGAHAVVASSWDVDDAATSFLMTTFHALRLEGQTVAAALAQAAAAVASEPGWEAPYYWAPFTVVQGRHPSAPASARPDPS